MPTPRWQRFRFAAWDRVASSDSAQYFYWLSPSPLGGPLSRGWCYREQVNNCLEVVVGGEVLEEVALLLHDAVELVDVDLAIAVTVGLVDHVLELLIIDGLTELLSHASEVAEGDLVGVVVIEELEHLSMSSRVSFSPILAVIMPRNSPNSMVPLPSLSMSETIFLSSSFLTSNPRARMAALSSRTSMAPDWSPSKRLKASRISSPDLGCR